MVPSGGATLEPSSQLVNKEVDKYPTLECRLRSSALRETRRVDTFGADPAADVQRVLGEEFRAANTKPHGRSPPPCWLICAARPSERVNDAAASLAEDEAPCAHPVELHASGVDSELAWSVTVRS